jgi:uncharacterized protein (DUF4415 family)
MTGKLMKEPVTSYKNLDHMPKPKPLSKRVKALTEKQLQNTAASDPDAGAIPPGFWEEATVIMPSEKIKVGIRLDNDVVEWFKSTGKGYQTRINAVLKSYMDAHKEAG